MSFDHVLFFPEQSSIRNLKHEENINNSWHPPRYWNSQSLPTITDMSIPFPSEDSQEILGLSEAYYREWDFLRLYIKEKLPTSSVMLLNMTKV